MENTEKKSTDEIDLLEVSSKAIAKLSNFLRWVTLLLQQVLIFTVRKSLWFIACVVAMLVFSYVTYKMQKPSYSTMMVAKMNVLDNAFAISYINDLNASLSDAQFTKKIFNLPDTVLAKQVKAIAAYWGLSYFGGGVDFVDFEWKHTKPSAMRDSLAAQRVGDRFFVRASVYSSDVQPYLTKGLVGNMCNLPYLQELNSVRKIQTQERMAELSRQIKVLDSLQHYEYFVKDAKTVKPSMMGQLLLLSEKDKTLLHSEIMRLHSERLSLQTDLQLNPDPVTVIQGFETNLQREQRFFSIAKRMLIVGLLLTLIAAIAWDYRKWLVEKVMKKREQ